MSPLIDLKNFSYAYPQVQPHAEPVWVLDGVDLAIESGEFVALMGRTGSGKTTLCLALNGIVPQSTGGTVGGSVVIAGQPSRTTPIPKLAQTVGLVFQEPETQLFNMTVEAEVAFGLETMGLNSAEIHSRIDWALSLVGMGDFRQHAPFQLSGGQKQRIAIAAIIAMKPPVLVLDEPTANLDPQGKHDVFAAVKTLRQQEGMTILMVSHESEQIADFADRVAVLNSGKIVHDEPPTTIFSPASKLQLIGIAVPQVSQLATQLNNKGTTSYSFVQLEEATNALLPKVAAIRNRALPKRDYESRRQQDVLFELCDVQFSYDGERLALDTLSLSIAKGEFVAILGQNGSGKTTLAKLFNGLFKPTAGDVLLNGMSILERAVADLAQTVGYVFQNPDHMIFNASVREELAAGPRNLGLREDAVAQRVNDALTQFDLTQYADQQPAALSFGLRRKVSVAAVAAMQTNTLILDEPTSGLDQRSSDNLMKILKQRHAQGHTILLITHDMRLVAQHIPRCIVMHDGHLLAHGDTRHVFQQRALLQRTKLEPPQINQLGERLGLGNAILTVDEFCRQVS